MKLQIKVKTNAKQEQVVEQGDGVFLVHVKDAPVDGKANERVIKVLAKHFDVAPSLVEIVAGTTSKIKRVVIHR